MILIASASSDTYITNKIVDAKTAVSGNVGRAGTLDLFKLYHESMAVTGAIEISRLLIKFDLSKAKLLSSSTLKTSDSSFSAKIRMKNISVGQPVPSNFTVQIFPLATPFDEGLGRDVISFADVDATNFLSSSEGTLWHTSGALKSGTLGDSNIDYYASGNLLDGNGTVNLGSTQFFQIGTEDLIVDITPVVSATISGLIPDNGFRISFIESQESDDVTRFVKRFASRHVSQQSLRPSLLLSYDDSIIDNHSSSYFDLSSSLFIHNITRGSYSNLVSGSSLTPVTGSNCANVRISTGSFEKYLTASQVSFASPAVGIYSASFSLHSSDASIVSGTQTIKNFVDASGSIVFDEVWSSLDKSVVFFSGTIKVERHRAATKSSRVRKLRASMLAAPPSLQRGQSTKIRVVFYDDYDQNRSSKFSFEPIPLEVSDCKVRLRDASTGDLIFDFNDSGSRMSSDSLSNYFTLETHSLPVGVPISLEYQIANGGETLLITNKSFTLVLSE